MRRVLAMSLAVALQAGALSAPFVHAHVDDHDEHHATSVHAHVAGHARSHHDHDDHDGITVADTDHDRAVYLQVFVAVEAPPFQTPDLPRASFGLTPVLDRAPRIYAIVTHGHDPPLVNALDSRPPPLFLS
jgi:hypothetical protein